MGQQMRERSVSVTSRATGETVGRAWHVPDRGQTFAGRIAELREQLASEIAGRPEFATSEETVEFLRLECNGCGTAVALDPAGPVYPRGWEEGPDGDFCPACRLCGRIAVTATSVVATACGAARR